MSQGRTLKVFLVDGTPTGLLTAEIMNWTGHVITGPRSRLGELIQRPEAQRTAVYFLVGPDLGAGVGTQVYIGETDDAARRLTSHNRPQDRGGKDFWERVCVVTSKDANLTKGHIKYLESRLLTIAKAAGRCELLNGTDPGYSGLPEADRSDMGFFLEQIQTLLPVLGYDFLRTKPNLSLAASMGRDGTSTPMLSPVFVREVRKHSVKARGQEMDGEFVVFKGGLARPEWTGGDATYGKLFAHLLSAGVLRPTVDGLHTEFTEDYAFASPSAAAAIVAGRASNGRTAWLIEGTTTSYGEWQAEQVNRLAPPGAVSEPETDVVMPSAVQDGEA